MTLFVKRIGITGDLASCHYNGLNVYCFYYSVKYILRVFGNFRRVTLKKDHLVTCLIKISYFKIKPSELVKKSSRRRRSAMELTMTTLCIVWVEYSVCCVCKDSCLPCPAQEQLHLHNCLVLWKSCTKHNICWQHDPTISSSEVNTWAKRISELFINIFL